MQATLSDWCADRALDAPADLSSADYRYGEAEKVRQHGAMGPGDCGGRRMAAKASHSRVRTWVPNLLAYAT